MADIDYRHGIRIGSIHNSDANRVVAFVYPDYTIRCGNSVVISAKTALDKQTNQIRFMNIRKLCIKIFTVAI